MTIYDILHEIFFWTGASVWLFIAGVVLAVLWLAVFSLWDREVRPSISNLRFAIFGKPWNENTSYYKLWCGMAKWHYCHYTRGTGNKHFARLAMKRLVYEARKECQKNKSH